MAERVQVTYFDTAMVLIEVDGIRMLTDPVLDAAGTGFDHGPVHLNKTGSAPITPEGLGRIDAVLLSHDQHGDNLDNAGLALLARVPLVLTTPEGAERLGSAAIGLPSWEQESVRGPDGQIIRVTGMPAQHGPDGTQDATGPVTGFLLTTNSGAMIYISGDTVPFKGTEEIARRCAPVDLAVLHLGRVRLGPLGDAPLSLSAEDAISYAEALQARRVLPVHFEGWAHFTEGRDAARETFAKSGLNDRTVWLDRGETASLELTDG